MAPPRPAASRALAQAARSGGGLEGGAGGGGLPLAGQAQRESGHCGSAARRIRVRHSRGGVSCGRCGLQRRQCPAGSVNVSRAAACSASFLERPRARAYSSVPTVTSTSKIFEWSGPVLAHHPVARRLAQAGLDAIPGAGSSSPRRSSPRPRPGGASPKSRSTTAITGSRPAPRYTAPITASSASASTRALVPAAGQLLAPAQPQQVAEAELRGPRARGSSSLTSSARSLRQLALVGRGEALHEPVAHREIHHRVAEELQPLVVRRPRRGAR